MAVVGTMLSVAARGRGIMSAVVAKVVVFGATGNTGLAVLKVAIDRGLKVTAFVRDPSKLPDDMKDKVEVIVGDVANAEDVNKAIAGQDGVVITLGTRNDLNPTTVISDGTKTIVEAMKINNVKNVAVCISGFLFYEDNQVPPRFRDLTEDHRRQSEVIKQSGLDWVAVCPPHIADDPAKGEYVVIEERMPGKVVSKFDLASLLLDCLNPNKYMHKMVGIGYDWLY